MEERLLRLPRLIVQYRRSDAGETLCSIICLKDLILYLARGVVYSSRADHFNGSQLRRVVDVGICCISTLNSEFALLLCTNGIVRIFSSYTGYSQDVFRIDLQESKKGEIRCYIVTKERFRTEPYDFLALIQQYF